MIRQMVENGSSIQFNLFFFNDTATTEIYTLSLHDALPIYPAGENPRHHGGHPAGRGRHRLHTDRSEEHTSELQSPCNLVCRLLLEKKQNNPIVELWQYAYAATLEPYRRVHHDSLPLRQLLR